MLKYYQNTVLYYDQVETGIGIITGWKKPNLIREHLTQESLNKIKTIGILYAKNGINYIIANLFLNPEINHLILLEDSDIYNTMSESIKTFLSFLKTEEIAFQQKFHYSQEYIHEFCTYFRKHVSVVSSCDLNEKINEISLESTWRSKPLELEAVKVENATTLTSEKQGFMIRANTVKEAWERSLKLVGTYGNLKLSDYDEKQMELVNLSIIVKGEDLSHPSMLGTLEITEEERHMKKVC